MTLLNRWDGPFDEKSVRNFLQEMRRDAAIHVYRTARTKLGKAVPDHRGWFHKAADGRFAAQLPSGIFYQGAELDLEEAVAGFCGLGPEYVIHNA